MPSSGWARVLFRLMVALAALSLASFARAASYAPPPMTGFVTDATGTLTPEQVRSLDAKLGAYKTCSKNHVAVFVAHDLQGSSIEDAAFETFKAWRLGKAGQDNGVLLVIAPQERNVRIETGKGVGGALTDVQSNQILREHVSSHMKVNETFAAIDEGTTAIGAALQKGGPPCPMSAAPTTAPTSTTAPASTPTATPTLPERHHAAREPKPYTGARIAMAGGVFVLIFAIGIAMRKIIAGVAAGGILACVFWVGIGVCEPGAFSDAIDFDLDTAEGYFAVAAVLLVIGNIVAWIARAQGFFRDDGFAPTPGATDGDYSGSSSGPSDPFGSSSSFGSTDASSTSTSGSSDSSSSSTDFTGGGGTSGGGGSSDSY